MLKARARTDTQCPDVLKNLSVLLEPDEACLSMARDGEGWHVSRAAMRQDSGIKKRQGRASAGWLCFGFWDEGD